MERILTAEQCVEIAERIIDRFYERCAGGTRFGVDWPTMRALFPRECRVFERLRARYRLVA